MKIKIKDVNWRSEVEDQRSKIEDLRWRSKKSIKDIDYDKRGKSGWRGKKLRQNMKIKGIMMKGG